MTAFNTGVLKVLDEKSGITVPLDVVEGTVIIEPLLTQKRNTARRRFTFMHEGAHWLIHRRVFSQDNPLGSPGVFENRYLAAKAGRVDYSRSRNEKNDIDRVERQADFLASALLMPKAPLRMAFIEFFQYYNEKARTLVRGRSAMEDTLAESLPHYVAGVFGVSAHAALIRLEKLNAILGKPARGYGAGAYR